MKRLLQLSLFLSAAQAFGAIPAAPLMTLYQFNGPAQTPYYAIDTFQRSGTAVPAGSLAQGSSVVPCLVIRNGQPLTDSSGTPFVGFEVIVDASRATPESTELFRTVSAARRDMTVGNHHCDTSVAYVIDSRNLYALNKPPVFEPPVMASAEGEVDDTRYSSESDQIIRAFHNSPQCAAVNAELVGRRPALQQGWTQFAAANAGRWSSAALSRARHLDFTMRTTIFEAHLERGCNAYGTCERNIIALSIRNRAREACKPSQGCSYAGDFEGVASKVTQYNIWDEYLTQISGLTACYLRRDLAKMPVAASGADQAGIEKYKKYHAIYTHNLPDIERVLFGDDRDLTAVFPGSLLADLKTLRHYYHAPAMGKCFPEQPRVEYMTAAFARDGDNFVMLVNTRIEVGQKSGEGYLFRDVSVEEDDERDTLVMSDRYRGFVVDGRKVTLRAAADCLPYGIPRSCRVESVGRYRKVPGWLSAGNALEIHCNVPARDEQCLSEPGPVIQVSVGAACDTQMRPVGRVP